MADFEHDMQHIESAIDGIREQCSKMFDGLDSQMVWNSGEQIDVYLDRLEREVMDKYADKV